MNDFAFSVASFAKKSAGLRHAFASCSICLQIDIMISIRYATTGVFLQPKPLMGYLVQLDEVLDLACTPDQLMAQVRQGQENAYLLSAKDATGDRRPFSQAIAYD